MAITNPGAHTAWLASDLRVGSRAVTYAVENTRGYVEMSEHAKLIHFVYFGSNAFGTWFTGEMGAAGARISFEDSQHARCFFFGSNISAHTTKRRHSWYINEVTFLNFVVVFVPICGECQWHRQVCNIICNVSAKHMVSVLFGGA